jgi:hypothetical protein
MTFVGISFGTPWAAASPTPNRPSARAFSSAVGGLASVMSHVVTIGPGRPQVNQTSQSSVAGWKAARSDNPTRLRRATSLPHSVHRECASLSMFGQTEGIRYHSTNAIIVTEASRSRISGPHTIFATRRLQSSGFLHRRNDKQI